MSSGQLNEQVNIAKLLFVGGLVKSVAEGQAALAKGKVYVQEWNISVAESTLPRWVLRGVSIRVDERSMCISEDGMKIRREQPREGMLA